MPVPRRRTHVQPPVDEFVTVAVIGHALQVFDRVGTSALVMRHGCHGLLLPVGAPTTAKGIRKTRLRAGRYTRRCTDRRGFDRWGYFLPLSLLESSVDKAATKASWGTSTRPTIF